ncbi:MULTISPECIES: hypothetical protein [unclassified Halanaerobium]|uniref:Spo0E family sporulation regulatory protein-aspartic acid phosphatase n=1 Tax=unclassified Halanaerobium TaxID=2641197 RepID=UPI000E14BF58|nr:MULTISPECIES: hypothetical protein [unclassified Halanaerobium]RCW44996.1 hypothetical protein DFR78_1182 [Halanaerobium sp. MA284_MarDTE_T2]RCW83275.1 hypothetical protein DER71_1172 [Halanaerobium sp. DL-01]
MNKKDVQILLDIENLKMQMLDLNIVNFTDDNILDLSRQANHLVVGFLKDKYLN